MPDESAPKDDQCGCDCGGESGACQASGHAETDAGGMQTTLGGVGSKYSSGFEGNLGGGEGIFNTDRPYMSQTDGGAGVAVVFDLCTAYWFDDDGQQNYTPRHGANVSLVFDYSSCCFTFTGPNGGVWQFDERGDFKGSTAAGGQSVEAASYNSEGQITQLQRQVDVGGQTVTDQLNYQYYDSGDNSGLIQSITFSRVSSPANDLQRIVYTYYGQSEAHGSVGDLKTSTRQKYEGGQWLDLETRYFRYYQDGEQNGFEHGLKYAVGPEGYRRLEQATGDPLRASDAQVAQQADYYYQYDAQRRVTLSKTEAGSQSYSMDYSESSHADDYNHWRRKTITTRADGTSETVYTNYVGDVILRDAKDGASHWIEYHQYNAQAREILRANPSAVIGYDEAVANLNVSLRSADGLIHTTEYYQSTTADESTAGGVAGRVKSQSIQRGTTGTPVKQGEYQYYARSAAVGGKVYPIAAETVYRNEDGTGAITTSFSYTWHGDTAQIEERVATLPAIPASQNGSGVSNTRTERFDTDGRLIWEKDERGFITRHVYDPVTESLIQTIQDVNTAQVSDAPSGWSTPSGGGKHIISDFAHDDLGRIVQQLGPEHEVDINGVATNVRTASWTVYDDANNEVRTAQGYVDQVSSLDHLVNPVSITKTDHAGRTVEEIQATRASTSGKLSESDTFAQSSYVRWSTSSYNDEGHLENTRVYHTIPSSGTGSSGTNYDQTTFGYDSMSRQNKTVSPRGTITRTVFSSVGRNSIPSKIYIGTDDTSATDSDPTGGGTPNNNMVLVSESEYDNGLSGGDGLLTKQTQHVDATTKRETTFLYDWRNRQTDADGEEDFYQKSTYDNLNQITRVDRHDTTSGGNLIARSETKYDDLGRVYQSKRYAVDVSTGTVGNSLTDNTWYDEAGNVIKQHPAGSQAFTKHQYDSLGRQVKQFIGFELDESSYGEALNVSGDTIFEQSETDYDDASNVIETRLRRRHHDATGIGELTTPSGSNPKARVSYVAFYADAIGRQIAVANYGTNDDTALSRSSTIPTSSDDILVTTTEYNDNGEPYKTTDPADKEDHTEFDDAGRVTKQIENYTDGNPTTGGNDEDITVCFTYTADGQQATITAKQKSSSDDQTTKYIYGTSLSDSDIARSDLLRAVIYPDSDDTCSIGVPPVLGDGPDGIYDRVEHKYNRQGEIKETKDQNETVHAFDFDGLGRQTHDRVTTLGSNIDGAVRRISTSYEVRGEVEKVSSYDNATVGSGSVVNEVVREYNDARHLLKQYEEHNGAKDANTPYIHYTYAESSGGGEFTKGLRPKSIRYPNGRLVHYTYGFQGSDADNLNRLDAIIDDNSGSPGDTLASYTYLGLGQMVIEDLEEPQVRLDYFGGTSGAYAGFDRFDRIVDQRWYDYGASEERDRFKYGYDRGSNRTWKENVVSKNLGTPVYFDEFYSYDGVHRLKNFDRGQLNGTKTGITGTPSREEDWNLDPLGNWSNYTQKTGGITDLDQVRTVNKANEIGDISETTGTAWSTPAYDQNGNMTSMPQPAHPSGSFDCTWDGWNRLVKVEDGTATIVVYTYDGLNRRVTKEFQSLVRHFFYSARWQIIEEQIDNSTTADRQFVWGPGYIDHLILRDRDTNQPSNGSLDERIYPVQDAAWNVDSILDHAGDAVERFIYAPFGSPMVLTEKYVLRAASEFNWEFCFAGRRIDLETDLSYFRARVLNSCIGSFCTRDPIGYRDTMNLFQATFVPGGVDPFGTLKRTYEIFEMTIDNNHRPDTIIAEVDVEVSVDTSECKYETRRVTLNGRGVGTAHCCWGDAEVTVSFVWRAKTGGTQHTMGEGEGDDRFFRTFPVYGWYKERARRPTWEGNLLGNGQRNPVGSKVSYSIKEKVKCDEGHSQGSLYLTGGRNANRINREMAGAVEGGLVRAGDVEGFLNLVAIFKVSFDLQLTRTPRQLQVPHRRPYRDPKEKCGKVASESIDLESTRFGRNIWTTGPGRQRITDENMFREK